MTTARWRRIEEVFHAAAEKPLGERRTFIEHESAGDPELRQQVESLLASLDATGLQRVEAAVAEAAADAFHRNPEAPTWRVDPGSRIGAYEVERLLGAGGMGRVYLARRADADFRQQVAIKTLRAAEFGDQGEETIRRFRAERQILANLAHPGIARLLDGGVTDSGQPYLVMEFVDGLPVDEYCRRGRLPVPERIRLFLRVCAAVHHAHQNLVVHRDIKPGNILVTAAGEPKLLDFGIAKLLEPSASVTQVSTRAFERLMTPEYASPEQARGEAITTASDVYALGVLLYELITGRRPFPLDKVTAGEAERIICLTEPPRPESDPDLDNVILMAMRKEPARRYPSAAALAEDLNRYLNGQPVQARPDTTTYRFRKFVARHRLAVGFAALVAVLIIGFGVAMAMLARQVSLERDSAEQVSMFLGEIFQLADPQTARGREITVREALDQGAARLSKTLNDRPGVKSDLLHRLGLVYENLGEEAKSRRLLMESIRLTRHTPGYDPLALAGRLKAAAELARIQKDTGAAIALARESLEIRVRRLGDTHPDTCESLNTLALALHAKGELAEAERRFRELLENRAPLRERPHLETAVLSNLGGVLYDQKRYAESEAALRELVDMRRKALPAPHPRIAMAVGKLAKTLTAAGKYDEAETLLRDALAMREQLHPRRPHPDIANSAINLGHLLLDTGRPEEALAMYRRGLEVRRALYPAGNAEVRNAERLVETAKAKRLAGGPPAAAK